MRHVLYTPFLVFCLAVSALTAELRVVTLPPYTFTQNGELVGINIGFAYNSYMGTSHTP